jgi:hypothetical protein
VAEIQTFAVSTLGSQPTDTPYMIPGTSELRIVIKCDRHSATNGGQDSIENDIDLNYVATNSKEDKFIHSPLVVYCSILIISHGFCLAGGAWPRFKIWGPGNVRVARRI